MGIDQSNICGMVGKVGFKTLVLQVVLIGIIQFGALSDSLANVQILNETRLGVNCSRSCWSKGLRRLNFYAGKTLN